MTKLTQKDQILAILREVGSAGLTPGDALNEVGTMRLGARIWDLRKEGHNIVNIGFTTRRGAHVARYVLIEGVVRSARIYSQEEPVQPGFWPG